MGSGGSAGADAGKATRKIENLIMKIKDYGKFFP